MSDPELLRAMRAAVTAARTNGSFAGGRVDTPTYSVAFNGVGYLVTCPRTVTMPCASVLVCETAHRYTHFIACRASASTELRL